ncbi:MAG: HdeD family acid-resistance protein [Candidatus Acidiferrales bacterium]
MSDPPAVKMSDVAKKAVGWSIAVSIIMIIAGLLAIAMPLEAGLAVNIFVGWMLIFAGLAHFVFAWFTRRTGSVLLKVLLGILYLGVAIYLLEHPARGLATLTLALAFYLLIEGIAEIVLYFQHRPASGSGWFLVDGIITLILGGMIWRLWPSSAEWVLGTIVGISIFFSGVTRLMISLAARRVVTKIA